MTVSKEEIIDNAYQKYIFLQRKIKEVYGISEEYPIFHADIDEILYNAEEYMHDLFMGIAFAQGEMTQEEENFINRLRVLPKPDNNIDDSEDEIKSVVSTIPLYIKLANEVDKHTLNTGYAKEFIKLTRDICKLLQDADGNTYANESEFMYGVTGKLEKFLRESENKNEK